jgi:pimeloyl-ACP methyl ester carboxylesterase
MNAKGLSITLAAAWLALGAAVPLSAIAKPEAVPPPNIVLFLHGLGGSAASWDEFVTYLKQTHPRARVVSPSIFNGRISTHATRVPGVLESGTVSAPADYAFYRITFGAFDRTSGFESLPNNGKPARRAARPEHGDYESFDKLGEEVDRAVKAILRVYPAARVALVAHSRGSLAARAFLQNPAYANETASIAGYLTQGATENGSYFGRIHDYLAVTSTASDPATWNVANALTKFAGLDIFSPTIGFLATGGTAVSALAATSGSLPPGVSYCNYCYTGLPYGELVEGTLVLGVLHQEDLGNVFTQAGLGAAYHVSAAAQTALIGSLDPETIGGDAIVQEDGEVLSSVPTIPPNLNLTVITNSNGIFHGYEPDEVEDIADGLSSSLGWEVAPPQAASMVAAETGPVENRLPAMEVLLQWIDAATRETVDDTRVWSLREAFADSLSHDDAANGPAYTESLSSALDDARFPPDLRVSLADALAETETFAATRSLLAAAARQGPLRVEMLKAIAHIGMSHRRDILYAEDLSPTLECALAASERLSDVNAATAISAALLNIGAESGIEAVGRFAAARRPGVMEIDRRLGDCGRVTNPHAIPALIRLFAQAAPAGGEPANESLLEFAGGNLVGLGAAPSVSPVLRWLRNAPDDAVPLVNLWFSNMNHATREATRQALQGAGFRSASVKTALATRLEANTRVPVYDSKAAGN